MAKKKDPKFDFCDGTFWNGSRMTRCYQKPTQERSETRRGIGGAYQHKIKFCERCARDYDDARHENMLEAKYS